MPQMRLRQTERTRERRGKKLPFRVSSFAAVCYLLSCFHQPAKAQRTPTSLDLHVSNFIDEETLNRCQMNLAQSDVDGDGELSTDEFVDFVSRQSNGSITVPEFDSVPLRLIVLFHWTACMCTWDPSEVDLCCVGDAAHISLADDGSDGHMAYISVFCSEIETGIDEVVNTPAPSIAPQSPSPTLSGSPSLAPVELESPLPSGYPSVAPSRVPSVETPAPTFEALLEVGFQYGIINSANLTADDILNERNNTVKRGLVTATRTVTIDILNETFPHTLRAPGKDVSFNTWTQPGETTFSSNRNDPLPDAGASDVKSSLSGSGSNYHGSSRHGRHMRHRRLSVVEEATERAVAQRLGRNSVTIGDVQFMLEEMYRKQQPERELRRADGQQGKVSSSRHAGLVRGTRRLVFYTDEIPVEIPFVIDNPVCLTSDPFALCAIVSSSVSVVLEDGDNRDMVRNVIINGFRESFESGDFENAIPPEDNFFDRRG